MKRDLVPEFEASLVGRSCVVARREYDWPFNLSDDFVLAISVPWRIVCGGRMAFGSTDDGKRFGLPAPFDGEAHARELPGRQAITAVILDRETADLALHFGEATRIDVFNDSLGYEGWQAGYAVEDKRWSLTALGGGELAFMAEQVWPFPRERP